MSEFIVMQENLGLGHMGDCWFTTRTRAADNLPPIIKDISEDWALYLAKCCNAFEERGIVKTLLKTCIRDAELANVAILATPTGITREKLTEINILRVQTIAEARTKIEEIANDNMSGEESV